MRGRQLPKGAPTYDFTKISRKLYEIERIWTRGGAFLAPPLDPPLIKIRIWLGFQKSDLFLGMLSSK